MESLKNFFDEIEEIFVNGFAHSLGTTESLDKDELLYIESCRKNVEKQLEIDNMSDEMRTKLNDRLAEYDIAHSKKVAEIKTNQKSRRALALKIGGIGIPSVVVLSIIANFKSKH